MPAARSYLYGAGQHSISAIGIAPSDVSQVSAAVHDINRIMTNSTTSPHRACATFGESAQLPAAGAAYPGDTCLAHRRSTGIALLIGTLGLAKHHALTVTDRTSEIASAELCACRAAILRQFLIESVLHRRRQRNVGVTVGVGLVMISQHLLPSTYGLPEMSMDSIGLAFGSACSSAGRRLLSSAAAARLCPMDALRY